jgi:outer membrane lipopolysaccharide assembly protein LptE/RlpB
MIWLPKKTYPRKGEGVRGTSLAVQSQRTAPTFASLSVGALMLVLGVLSGCGYRLSGQAGTIPANLQRISVPIFTNATGVPGLEQSITAAIRTRLQRDGRVRLGTETNASAELRGEVRRYELRLLATDSSIFALEYRIEIEVRIVVEDVQLRQTILDQSLMVDTDYVVSSQVIPTDISRERALLIAANNVGERVVSFLLDRF